MLFINRRISIPLRELSFQYTRSSGAGGQHVNKVSSKAMLRWQVERSPSLPDDVRQRFRVRYRRRMTHDGELVITSQRFREQGRNVADCLEKLRSMLQEVASPAAKRRPTKPGRAAQERRLQGKRARSVKKQRRGSIRADD